jgi:hypothetical protein
MFLTFFLPTTMGNDNITALKYNGFLCRREGIAPSLYYKWSKSFLEADKKRIVVSTSQKV